MATSNTDTDGHSETILMGNKIAVGKDLSVLRNLRWFTHFEVDSSSLSFADAASLAAVNAIHAISELVCSIIYQNLYDSSNSDSMTKGRLADLSGSGD